MFTWLAVLPYLGFLAWVTVRLLRPRSEGEGEYLLSSRRLTLPAFVATTVSTWYGGILGVGEYSYTYGLSNWFVFGVPYYLYAAIFALFLAGRARRMPAFTVPDQIRSRYGPAAGIAGAAVLFVVTAPAAYVLALGLLVQHLTGWPLWLAAVAGAVASLAYVWRGGLPAVVLTDKVQFLLMFGGFALILPFAAARLGGPTWLLSHLPPSHLEPTGGQPWQSILVWYVLAATTLVEPAFYQRCAAARDEATARRGLLVSIAFWFLFDLMTTTAGLYARAAIPDLGGEALGAQAAYPALSALILPPVAQAVFVVGLMATIMSTLDSYGFIAAVTFGRDVVWRARGSRGDPNGWSQAGLVVTAAVSVGLALWKGSIVGLWHDLGSMQIPALLLPLAWTFTGRPARRGWVLAAMVGGGGTAVGWLWAQKVGWAWAMEVQAVFPGLIVSAVAMGVAVGRGITRKPTARAGGQANST